MSDSHPAAEDQSHDAAKHLAALLWGPEQLGTRGPKPALSRESVIDAAIAEADTGGLEALSMRAVGERLGASTTGLYRYVPGRTELIALMVERVAELQATDDDRDAESEHAGWRQRLTRHARREWESYHRHPWLLEIPARRIPPGPHVTSRYDSGLAAALDTGLPASEALTIFQAVDHLVIGAAQASTENAALTQQTGMSSADWWTQQGDAGLFGLIERGRFPAIAAVLEAGGFSQGASPGGTGGEYAAAFEQSLRFLLDGIAIQLTEN